MPHAEPNNFTVLMGCGRLGHFVLCLRFGIGENTFKAVAVCPLRLGVQVSLIMSLCFRFLCHNS